MYNQREGNGWRKIQTGPNKGKWMQYKDHKPTGRVEANLTFGSGAAKFISKTVKKGVQNWQESRNQNQKTYEALLTKARGDQNKNKSKDQPKDQGGKVTYKHRDTGSDTGIQVAGKTLVSTGNNNNKNKGKIRNNVETTNQKTPPTNQQQETKKDPTPTTVFTKHYKTGKELGVMTRAERRAYEKEAGTKTWESEKKRLKATGNKQNIKASSKSWRRKQELKLAKQNKKKEKNKFGSSYIA